MNCTSGPIRLARVLAPSTIVLLALLALLACGDSTGEPVPSPTPRSVLFATPPSAASTGDDDESGSDITVELNQTATPYPTSTPYPTATPYPTPTPYPVAVGSGEQTSGLGPSVPEVTTVAPQAGPTIRIAIPKKSEVKHPKADSAINSLVERVESGEITEEEAASEAPLHRGDSVGVIILLSGNVGGVVAFLEANGATNINAGEDYIEAFVPVLHLGQTSEQPGVLRVDQIQPPGETQGTPQVTGQGPGVHGSEAWNDAGFSGQGIKVGVIDRGFSGFSDIMGTEVPATVEARCYTWLGQHSRNLSDCSDGGTHGTVVSESVLDIAPEVTLYISDPQSLSELRDAVDWMISEGVSVINHSRLWAFDGPGDGTSPLSISPLNSIDRAVTAGIVWVNAAGNQATGTWFKRGPFDYTTETIDGEEVRFLRFSGSEIRNTNSYIGGRLELRWEDEWGGAETDLDLFALASGTDEIVLQSIDLQSGGAGHNPYESVGSIATFDVMVAHRGGPDPDWIQLVGWGPTRLTLNSSGAGSIINPAESANRGMLAVGAAPWSNTNVISSFSSRGPTPDERIKPDVVAANCGETATRSAPFCGTSQASPHVAGLAALVRQRFPNYTPAQVVSYIKNNAEQRISSLDPNDTWGHGFFVLPTVTQATQPPVTVPGVPSVTSVTPSTGSLTVAWRAPLQTGGAAITAYDLRHIRSDAPSRTDGNWTVVRRVWSGAGALSYTLTGLTGGTRYDVQVRAVNPAGEGPWSPTRTGTTTQATPCATGGAVANAASNAGLVSDCDTLLELRNTLAGTGTLNWAAGTPITNWDGITVGGTPQRIIMLYLPHQGLTGILPQELGDLNGLTQLTLLDNKLTGPIPSELANLSQLTHIFLGDNQLSAPIPSELGRMTKLQGLELYGNRLTGTIPTELAGLTNLQALHIDTNQLTGVIPRELGRLTNLKWLTLHDNQLTGEIPAELGRLTHLEQLWLAGNQFAGCVPADLRNVFSTDRTHRLKDIGIPYCDVLLSGLGITSSTLSPQFDAYITDYRAAARASRITVSPSSRHNATFEYLDGDDNVLADSDGAQAGYQVDAPATMATTIKIKVTSSDDKANHTYTIQLTGPGALGAPEVHQVTAGTNSLTVSWTAPSSDGGSSITAYDLRHIRSDATNKGDANWTVVQDVWTGSGARRYELAGLRGGTHYDVQLRAVNSAGDGAWSATATGATVGTAPGAPTGLTAIGSSQTQVDLSWGAPMGNGEIAITGYRIEVSPDRSSWSDLVANTGNTATGYSHTGLTAGTTRHYRVSAINSAGTGQASGIATGTTAAAGVPASPTNTAVTAGTEALTVSWRAPSSDGGSPITAYDLRHIRSDATNRGDANWIVVQDVWTGSGALSYEMTGLDGGVSYDVQVRAVINAGDGAWSSTATGTPEATTPVPASPADTQFHRDGATTVVTWGPSTGATHYKVYHSDSRFARCTLLLSGTLSGCGELSGSVSGTTYTHTDPDADTNHYWVTACNSAGCSEIDSSNPARFMDNRPPAPANSQFRRDGSTTLISWDPSTGATHYKVYYDDFFDSSCRLSRGSPSFCDELAGNVSGTSYTHTDPDEDENYYWVTACNNAGCLDIDSANPAAFVETTPVVTAPGAPTRLTATADGQTEIDLSWTGPSDDGGVDITGYRIEVSNNGSSWSNLEANTNSASTTYTHTGLMAGDTRHYRVSAINSEGTGPVSDTDDATTNSPAVATPGAPTSLTATADGETEIDLSWTAPSDNGGADITGYKIEVSTNGSTWSDLEANTGNAATTYSHTGLTAGSTRHYRVSAINSAVTGPASITDSATTNAATPSDTRACATDGAVASPDNNEDLVSECEVLLGLKNRLVGTGSLNWSPSTLISSWDGITVGGSPARVTRLELRVGGSKRVTGQLPAALGELAKLEVLAIYGASTGDGEPISLTGSIPAELGNLTELSELTLHQHEISGTIPAALGNLSKLEKLQLNFTQIGGSIPASLGNLSKLKTLSLYDNDLSGTLPAELGRLGNLQTLNLNLNRVTGSIPAQFGNLSSLLTLALSFNQLSGSIPTELAGLSSLQEIYVSQNNFTGCIPSALQEVAKNDLARVGLPDCDGSTEPGKPTGLAAAADGQSEIDLSWTAPSDDGGADITGYRIEVSNNGSNWTDLVADTNSTRTSYSHTGLAAGSTRHYRVSAINSAGTRPVSNTDSATTDAATAPDLVLDAPTVSNSNPVVGTLFGFSITVRNQGNGAAKGGLVGYLISIDPTVTLSDRLLERDHSFGRLAPGETRSLTTPLTAPSTPGTYYYAACVRLDGTGEIDTTNNCSTSVKVTVSSPPAPDLSVDMPTVDDSTLETGDSFTLSATVRNGGDASSASTTLRYYRSTDSTITSSDTSAGTDSVSGLNAGGSGNESIDLTAPSTAGTYYYGACVDSVSGESDTTNNCSSGVAVTVSTATAPVQATTCSVDLVVSPGESCVYPGQSDEFSVDSSGRGSFLFTTSGERIEIRNSNINGVTYTLVAGKQSDGTWKIEEVG